VVASGAYKIVFTLWLSSKIDVLDCENLLGDLMTVMM